MSWKMTRLSMAGVKGILERSGEFDLGDGKSIAVYAPNGCGKSGYADAVEYLFAKDGAVEHLGQGGPDSEHGGKHAIPHVLAQERGVTSVVSATLRRDSPPETIKVTREVKTGRIDPLPAELEAVVRAAPAHRILRQHDLRRFVVDMPPRDKYSELSRWLGLEDLESVLSHLTTAKNELTATDPDREFKERLQDVVKHTDNQITEYDLHRTLAWCATEAQKHLGGEPEIKALDELDEWTDALRKRRDEFVVQSGGISGRHKAKQKLEGIASDVLSSSGKLASCKAWLRQSLSARQRVDEALKAAKESIFQEVWETSRDVLEKEQVDNCPVCMTPWTATQVGSQDGALAHLKQSLERLSELSKAQSREKECVGKLHKAVKALETSLRELKPAASVLSLPEIAQEADSLAELLEPMAAASEVSTQVHDECTRVFEQCTKLITERVKATLPGIKIEGMPVAAKAVEDSVDKLLGLRGALTRLGELQAEREEYRRVEQGFSDIAATIQKRTGELVDAVVQALRTRVEGVYRKIHPASAVPNVHITPDAKNKTLSLRVDFHSPGRTVPPGGYLSESQINSLGIALFVSCVRLFNKGFPFVFLDDIVSSYDADHRARIVDVIAEDLQGFQVFLTTHDEQFYSMLKSRLITKGWLFERITGWTLEEGPSREADSPKPELIESLIKGGNPQIAGNMVRQVMEEWLDKMCAEYQAYTVHKRGPKEFDRTLFDYWGPFITRLKKVKGGFFKQRVEPQECYQRVQAYPLINWYSHAQSNPYTWASMGDVRYVWEELQAFQWLFRCCSCSRTLKYDRDADRLYCVCGGQIFSD